MLCSTGAVRTVCSQPALPRGQQDHPPHNQHDQPQQGPSPSSSSTVSISSLYTAFYTHGSQGVQRYLPLPRTSSQRHKSRCTTAFSSLSTLNSLALSTTNSHSNHSSATSRKRSSTSSASASTLPIHPHALIPSPFPPAGGAPELSAASARTHGTLSLLLAPFRSLRPTGGCQNGGSVLACHLPVLTRASSSA